MTGSTATALSDQGWVWMRNPRLPAPQLLARKIEEGSLGISRRGVVYYTILSHMLSRKERNYVLFSVFINTLSSILSGIFI